MINNKINSKTILSILLAVCVNSNAYSQEIKNLQPLSFESNKALTQIETVNSKAYIDDTYAKFGTHSLRWNFNSSSTLTINKKIGFKRFDQNSAVQARHSFITWIYNPKPIQDTLKFNFNQANDIKSSFVLNLNFKGWRAVAIPFESDMQGTPTEDMDSLSIVAPAASGKIYFDLMFLSLPVDPRWPTPDYQVPFVNKTIAKRANAHWGALLHYDNKQQAFENSIEKKANKSDLITLKTIEGRIDKDLLQDQSKLSTKNIWKLLNKGEKLVEQDRLKLRPVQMWRQLEVYKKAAIDKDTYKALNKQTLRFETLAKHLLSLSRAWHLTENESLKIDIQAQFTTYVTHLFEQGFVRGSAGGIMHHQGYPLRYLNKALFLGRDMLSDENKQKSAETIAWLTGLGRIFTDKKDNMGFNVDVMNTFLPGMLMSILMQSEDKIKIAYLRKMSDWMSYSMTATKGLGGGIQPDGSFFHHSQHYIAYGNGGLTGLSPVVYYLSRTPYFLTEKAYKRLQHAVLMTSVFSNGLKAPMSLAGRHPEEYPHITLEPFKYLSMLGDKKVTAAYFRLLNLDAETLINKGSPVLPEKTPNGSWVMNYSGLTIHRRNEWLATARGFSRYLVGNETYSNANHFGRYLNYGHLEIFPSASVDSGFNENGWDWNRWPGTTTVHLPLNKLAAKISQVDQYSGVEEMLLSTETFSGGNQLQDQNSMFAMKLRGHDKYNSNLKANKSVFFFDNRIIALGSGISQSSQDYPVETTLFQQSIIENEPSYINNKAITSNSFSSTDFLTQPQFYQDLKGNHYFVPEDYKITFSRKQQHSKENEHKKPTVGTFASAYIGHGNKPQNAKYEYAILVNSSPQEALKFNKELQSENPPYQVKALDNKKHIIKDKLTQITAYSLFTSNSQLEDELIRANNTPVMVMAKPYQKGLIMSVVDPDLNLYQGIEQDQLTEGGKQKEVSVYSRQWRYQQPQPKQLTLILNGQWSGEGNGYKSIPVNNHSTLLKITSVAAKPVEIKLNKVK